MKGETTGDGAVDVFDLFEIADHINDETQLEGVYQEAADYNSDEEIDLFDVFDVADYINAA